jgi:hypothetical protein
LPTWFKVRLLAMRSLVDTLILLLVTIAAVGWLALNLRAKSKYDQLRKESDTAYTEMPMDQQATEFLAEVQSKWTCTADVTNGPDADAVRLAGRTPSVRHLIDLVNFRMPPYRWFSASQNRRSIDLYMSKAVIMPVSVDQQWHVSQDRHLALLRFKTNVVCVYRDDAAGLRATMYHQQPSRRPPAPDASSRKEKAP